MKRALYDKKNATYKNNYLFEYESNSNSKSGSVIKDIKDMKDVKEIKDVNNSNDKENINENYNETRLIPKPNINTIKNKTKKDNNTNYLTIVNDVQTKMTDEFQSNVNSNTKIIQNKNTASEVRVKRTNDSQKQFCLQRSNSSIIKN